MLATVLDNQKLLVEKLTEMETRSSHNQHAHRRRTKEASALSEHGVLKKEGSHGKRRDLLHMAGESDRSIKLSGAGSNGTDEDVKVVNRLVIEESHGKKR